MENILIILFATILTTLAGVGATIIITKSYLFRPLQRVYDPEFNCGADIHPKLNKLFNCPLCVGAWVGFFLQVVTIVVVKDLLQIHSWHLTDILPVIYQGFITSICSYITYLVLVALGHGKQ